MKIREGPWTAVPPCGTALNSKRKVRRLTDTALHGAFGTTTFMAELRCAAADEEYMIATVTLNPAIDKSLTVPSFEVGKTNRGEVTRTDAGGKGINVAKAVKQFDADVYALGFVAGSYGQFIIEALAASGIPADFCNLPGETRVNLKIHDPVYGTETELNEPGFQVFPEHLQAMKEKIIGYASRCQVMIFSGSLPPGAPPETFAEFMKVASRLGAKCMLDTAGAALRCGLEAKPFMLKPNRTEVEELLQVRLRIRRELGEAARKLLAMGAEEAVISMGAEGALAARSLSEIRFPKSTF